MWGQQTDLTLLTDDIECVSPEAYDAPLALSSWFWRRLIDALWQTGVSAMVQGARRAVRWEVRGRRSLKTSTWTKSENTDTHAHSKTTPWVPSKADPSSTISRCDSRPHKLLPHKSLILAPPKWLDRRMREREGGKEPRANLQGAFA